MEEARAMADLPEADHPNSKDPADLLVVDAPTLEEPDAAIARPKIPAPKAQLDLLVNPDLLVFLVFPVKTESLDKMLRMSTTNRLRVASTARLDPSEPLEPQDALVFVECVVLKASLACLDAMVSPDHLGISVILVPPAKTEIVVLKEKKEEMPNNRLLAADIVVFPETLDPLGLKVTTALREPQANPDPKESPDHKVPSETQVPMAKRAAKEKKESTEMMLPTARALSADVIAVSVEVTSDLVASMADLLLINTEPVVDLAQEEPVVLVEPVALVDLLEALLLVDAAVDTVVLWLFKRKRM